MQQSPAKGSKSHAYQAHQTGHNVNKHGSWCWILEQPGREHGWPNHLNGVLFLSQFQRDASNYPWQIIPMQGLCDFHKPWLECLSLTDGTPCCGSTSWAGVAHQLTICMVIVTFAHPTPQTAKNNPLGMSPTGSAMSAFPWGGLLHPRGCYLNPIGGWNIFQNLHISTCGQELYSISKLQHTFHQLGRLTWGQWLGFFPPNVGGPLHKPGSFEVTSANSLGHQTTYPGVTGIDPCPVSGMLVVWSSHSLLLRRGISL